ncbi:MAG: PQQ-dependent sugar dehydrogenase [Oligoflexia bacterium]|nr:PQQ-dependent sugar dehydrogenase [Oligoflexia bacterium]
MRYFGSFKALSIFAVVLSSLPLFASIGAAQTVTLTKVFSHLKEPTCLTNAGDGSNRLFVAERRGVVRIFDGTKLLSRPFLNIREKTVTNSNERGLLAIAFDPQFSTNGYFYVSYTNLDHDGIFSRFKVSRNNPNVADPHSEHVLLRNEHSKRLNHYGGDMHFGSDGYLYLSIGDGGYTWPEPGDPEHHAQSLRSIQGKILRIDVSGARHYRVPADNPFVGRAGARAAIWAYGFRNPWKFSFDPESGRLFVGDVGHYLAEEVDIVEKGGDYGWSIKEGVNCYNADSCNEEGLTDPIHQYVHSAANGNAIIGGYVYRGASIPELVGKYVYTDFVGGKVWTLTEHDDGWHNAHLLTTDLLVSSFGEDEAHELYLVTYTGTVYRFDPVTP